MLVSVSFSQYDCEWNCQSMCECTWHGKYESLSVSVSVSECLCECLVGVYMNYKSKCFSVRVTGCVTMSIIKLHLGVAPWESPLGSLHNSI